MESKLSNLAISGWSAGALGAQAWADALLSTFPAEQQEVIPDSYIGLFPDGTQGTVLKDTWPVCDGGFLQGFMSDALIASCEAETITMQQWLLETMAEHPEVPVSFIQSKYVEHHPSGPPNASAGPKSGPQTPQRALNTSSAYSPTTQIPPQTPRHRHHRHHPTTTTTATTATQVRQRTDGVLRGPRDHVPKDADLPQFRRVLR